MCILISLIFGMIAAMEATLMGSAQDDIDSIVNAKMTEYIDHLPKKKNDTANKGSGAKAELQADTLEGIQMALKLVPNMD